METKTRYRHKETKAIVTKTGTAIDMTGQHGFTMAIYTGDAGINCACRSIEFLERYEIVKEIPEYCDLCDSLVRLSVASKTILFKCGENGRRIGSAIGCLTVCPTPEWCDKEIK